MTAYDHDFRIDSSGPALLNRRAFYAVGEDVRRGYAGGKFEKAYLGPVFGVVESGTFKYRSETGDAVVAPGSIIFGNAGESFSCEHLDANGNRRSVVRVGQELMDEAAAAVGRSHPRFATAIFPPGPGSLAMQASIRRLVRSRKPREDVLLTLLADALALDRHSSRPSSDREIRRILNVVRFMEVCFAEPHPVATLASRAGVSRFHFLREFRRLVGTTPTQFLIGLRLRAAARRLEESAAPVTEIAFDTGFNDISHFNHLFRRAFSASPGQWRRLAR